MKNWEKVKTAVCAFDGPVSFKTIQEYIDKHLGEVKPGSIRACITTMTVNDPSRIHHKVVKNALLSSTVSQYNCLFKTISGEIVPHKPHIHGVWNVIKGSNGKYEAVKVINQTEPVRKLEDVRVEEDKQLSDARRLIYSQLFVAVRESNLIPEKITVQTIYYRRNQKVVAFAKRIAKGKCALCEQPAPFMDENREPYLEVHHIQWLARDGSDRIENVIALCPNCHRRMHILDSANDKKKLSEIAEKVAVSMKNVKEK